MSGAKSAIKVCLLLPRMLSDFLKACTYTAELRLHYNIDIIILSCKSWVCPYPCHRAQRLVSWNTEGLTDAFQLSLHMRSTLFEPGQSTGVDKCRYKHTCICLTYLSSIGSAYRSNARAFFTGSLSSRAFASALGNIWTAACRAAFFEVAEC